MGVYPGVPPARVPPGRGTPRQGHPLRPGLGGGGYPGIFPNKRLIECYLSFFIFGMFSDISSLISETKLVFRYYFVICHDDTEGSVSLTYFWKVITKPVDPLLNRRGL